MRGVNGVQANPKILHLLERTSLWLFIPTNRVPKLHIHESSFFFKSLSKSNLSSNTTCSPPMAFLICPQTWKCLKDFANPIFLIWTVQTFFRNKLPIYENVGEERDQNVTNCYRYNFCYLQYCLFPQEMYD